MIKDIAKLNRDLLEQNEWLKLVFEHMNAGILITDPNQDDNPIIYANRFFCDMTGYAKEELMGRNCRFLQGENTDKEAVTKIRKAIEKRLPITLRILNYRKNGEPFMNELMVSPVFDYRGKLINFVGIQHEVDR